MNSNSYKLSDIISNSLGLAWKHKILWVFALMLIGGSTSNFSKGNNGLKDLLEEKTPAIETTIPETLDITLDLEYLNTHLDSLIALGEDAVSPVTDWDYVFSALIPNIMLGGFSVFSLILGVFVLTLIIKSWAYGAMLKGVWNGLATDTLSLRELGTAGLKYFANMFKLFLWSFVFIFSPMLILSILMLPIMWKNSTLVSIMAMVLIPIYLVYLLIFSLVRKYADRFIVYEDLTPLASLKTGFITLKKVFWKSFGLGFLNMIVVGVISVLGIIAAFLPLLAVGIPISILVANTESVSPLILPLVVISLPVILLFILILLAIKGFVGTYKEFTWTFMYRSQKEVTNV